MSLKPSKKRVISFYIFTLPFFVFSKECLYEMKEIGYICVTQEITG